MKTHTFFSIYPSRAFAFWVVSAITFLVVGLPLPLQAGTAPEKILYSFGASNSAPNMPNAGLMQASDGNFYGTSRFGGTGGLYGEPQTNGTLYRLTPAGRLKVLYNFCSQMNCNDGGQPWNTPIEASDGNLYGTTSVFGAHGAQAYGGTIWQYNLKTGKLAIVYTFQEGGLAVSDLIDDGKGTLYGTTDYDDGKQDDSGTVFSYNYTTNIFTTLVTFAPSSVQPQGGLVLARDGYLYGTLRTGGTYGLGAAFVLNTDGSNYQMFYSFTNGGNFTNDGELPTQGLSQYSDGNLYGTTNAGSNEGTNAGVFFQIVPDGVNSKFNSITGFQWPTQGCNPWLGRPFIGGDGYFYLTGTDGGAGNIGQAMRLDNLGNIVDVYDWVNNACVIGGSGGDGCIPEVPPFESTDGNLWGTTECGGQYMGDGGAVWACGTIYKLVTKLPPVITLTAKPKRIGLGQSVTLTWAVNNAYSKNAQVCIARSSDGSWTGSKGISGKAKVKPVKKGTIKYAFTCGGVESALATVTVTSD